MIFLISTVLMPFKLKPHHLNVWKAYNNHLKQLPYNKHFLLTCKPLLLIFKHGRHAAEMPDRYMAGLPLTKLSISIINKTKQMFVYTPILACKRMFIAFITELATILERPQQWEK
jgi:hypothetical protein